LKLCSADGLFQCNAKPEDPALRDPERRCFLPVSRKILIPLSAFVKSYGKIITLKRKIKIRNPSLGKRIREEFPEKQNQGKRGKGAKEWIIPELFICQKRPFP